MSLGDLTGAGKTSIFPDHTLSPPRLIEFAQIEEFAATDFLMRVHKATAGMSIEEARDYRQRAVDILHDAPPTYGTVRFTIWANSLAALPFMAWLLFRQSDEKMTLATATDLVMNGTPSQRAAIYSMWGYVPKKAGGQRQANPPNGTESSTASPTQKAEHSPTTSAAS